MTILTFNTLAAEGTRLKPLTALKSLMTEPKRNRPRAGGGITRKETKMENTKSYDFGKVLNASAELQEAADLLHAEGNDEAGRKVWKSAQNVLPEGPNKIVSYISCAIEMSRHYKSPYLVLDHTWSGSNEWRSDLVAYITDKTDCPALIVDRDPSYILNSLLAKGWSVRIAMKVDCREDADAFGDRNRGVLFTR